MTDRQILDSRIKNLNRVKGMYIFGAIFFLHPVPFISIFTFGSLCDFDRFHGDMSNPIASFLLSLLCFFMLLFFGVWFAKYARIDGYYWDDVHVSDSDIRLIVICD